MFKKIKEFFTGKPAVVETPAPVAEYKVEVPVAEVAPAPVVEAKPAKKKPAAKKAPAAPKKPRAPKKPKAE